MPALAIDRHLYSREASREDICLTHDVVLVGGYSSRRELYLEGWGGLPLEIYGPGWRKQKRMFHPLYKRAWQQRGIWGKDLVNFYHQTKIVINITSCPGKLTGQNLRLYDVPATGTFLITDDSPEVRDMFKVGKEIEVFSSSEELADKTKYYLANSQARELIALNGYFATQRMLSYKDRMASIMGKI